MKITFVYFDFMKGAGGKYHEGIASISAVLKQNGHTTRLFHLTKETSPAEFMSVYNNNYHDSDIVAFSATSNAFIYIAEYSKVIKEKYNETIIICGGIHPTLCPEDSIQQEGLDIICVGEGEHPMLELCTNLQEKKDITAIQNLWIKKDGKVYKNPARPLMKNLDELPMPDRDLFVFEGSADQAMKRMPFMGSRGCPYTCSYCCNHALKKVYSGTGPYVRFKSIDRLLNEIEYCLKKHPNTNEIHFLDDILTINKKWFTDFALKYKERINLPYVCNSRYDLLNENNLKELKDSGCVRLQLGLESGDKYIRIEVLKRKQSESQILNISQLCHDMGFKLYVYTMVGIPFENLRSALNTVKLSAKIRPDSIQTSIYYPYIKTELYDISKKNGYLTDKRLDSYFEADSALNLPDFPKDKIIFAYQNFNDFITLYITAAKLPKPVNALMEISIDFMWLHPRIYGTIISVYRRLKKIKKKL